MYFRMITLGLHSSLIYAMSCLFENINWIKIPKYWGSKVLASLEGSQAPHEKSGLHWRGSYMCWNIWRHASLRVSCHSILSIFVVASEAKDSEQSLGLVCPKQASTQRNTLDNWMNSVQDWFSQTPSLANIDVAALGGSPARPIPGGTPDSGSSVASSWTSSLGGLGKLPSYFSQQQQEDTNILGGLSWTKVRASPHFSAVTDLQPRILSRHFFSTHLIFRFPSIFYERIVW